VLFISPCRRRHHWSGKPLAALHSVFPTVLFALLAASARAADDVVHSETVVVDMTVSSAASGGVVPPKWLERGGFYPRIVSSGKVAAALVVAADGSVSDVKIVDSSGREIFDSSFMEYLRHQRFVPGSREGKPVAVRIKATGIADGINSWVAVAISLFSKELSDCMAPAPEISISACTALIAGGHDYALQRIFRARAYVAIDRDDDALDDLAAAELLNAHGGEISRLRGFVYEKRGDYQKAIDNYGDAMDMKASALALMDRGLAYEMLGRVDLAAADFKSAVGMAPDCGKPDCKPGGDAQIAMLDARIAQNPDDIAAFANRCVQRSISGHQLSMGLFDCNHVQARMAGEPNTLEARGLIFLRTGQFADAIQDFNAALAGEPKRATSLYLRGIAKFNSGDAAAGHADFIAARNINSAVAASMAFNGIIPG
jgi:TonB family protein